MFNLIDCSHDFFFGGYLNTNVLSKNFQAKKCCFFHERQLKDYHY